MRKTTGRQRYTGSRFLSRAGRRNMPSDDNVGDDDSTLASVDTAFVRNLVESSFSDDNYGGHNAPPPSSRSRSNNKRIEESLTPRSEKRFWLTKKCSHVIFGMVLMYIILNIWEGKQTKTWWRSYKDGLDESMYAKTIGRDPYSIHYGLQGRSSSAALRGSYPDVSQQRRASGSLYQPLSSTAGLRSGGNTALSGSSQSSMYLPTSGVKSAVSDSAKASSYLGAKPAVSSGSSLASSYLGEKSGVSDPQVAAYQAAKARAAERSQGLSSLSNGVSASQTKQESLWHQAKGLSQQQQFAQYNPTKPQGTDAYASSQNGLRPQTLPDQPQLTPPVPLSQQQSSLQASGALSQRQTWASSMSQPQQQVYMRQSQQRQIPQAQTAYQQQSPQMQNSYQQQQLPLGGQLINAG